MAELRVIYPHDWQYDSFTDSFICPRCTSTVADPANSDSSCSTPVPSKPYYLAYDIGEELVNKVFDVLPSTFQLYAHDGTFRASRRPSFYSPHEGVQIVIQIADSKYPNGWVDFLRTTPEELSRAIKKEVKR